MYAFFNDNKGPGYCSNKGISMCTNEIIFRMDSDDIMSHNRIETQLQFMKNTPDCVICGSNIQFFHVNNENQKIRGQTTNHPLILTWDQYKIVKSHWFMNHPSICYKKSAVLSVGNYGLENLLGEDLELELKILKKYGKIYNIFDNLIFYRIHSEQMTYNGKSTTSFHIDRRNKFIENIINE